MKTKLLLLLALVVFTPYCAGGRNKWSTQDKTLEGTYQVLHVLDWGQTRDIAKNPDKYYEMNPILGKHPSTTEVDIYFITTAILHPIVTHLLPNTWRPWWQGITISVSGVCVVNNFAVGIKMDF